MATKLNVPPTQGEIIKTINDIIDDKQDTLVSGTNIKTINNESVLGSGNITISGGTPTDVQINGTSITSNNVANIVTESAYNSSTNKIATMSDVPDVSNYLTNTATGNNGLTIGGTASTTGGSTNIGMSSIASKSYSTAIGYNSQAKGNYSTTVGWNAMATKQNAIQIGWGTNTTENSLSVGFYNQNNYKMLDGTTGLIPDDRLNTTIARTSQIPTVPTNVSAFTNDAGYTTNVGTVTEVNNTSPDPSGNVTLSASDIGAQATLVSGTNIKTINNESILGSGNISITGGTGDVTTNTDQNITGVKTFVGQKRIAFKQSSSSDKLGFTLYNNSGTEKGYLEYNPSNTVDSVPLMTLGNYATASSGLTHIGFRKYSSVSGASGAYNLLAPLVSDARTPFSLTTTYTNFYMPLGFKNGSTQVTTAKSGVADLSTLFPTIATSVSSSSTNAETVGAKLFYDTVGDIETLLSQV